MPQYLSPTSMTKWQEDPAKYYLQYLSDNPLPKEPQTLPMAVGSAFDAYVKSFLYEHLFGDPGKAGNDARFGREAIFEAQVEPALRTEAHIAGDHCLGAYRRSGALDALMAMLGKTVGRPRFEMDVRGVVSAGRVGEVRGVPFRVKPDLFFVNEQDAHVILDWKVNGYCSKSGVSPMKGYVRLRNEKRGGAHDEARPEYYKGILVNVAKGLEAYSEEWARQCSVGSWMCGEEVGAKFIAVIHQLACKPGVPPRVWVAEHSGFVTEAYQQQIHKEAAVLWETIHSKHVFRNMTEEESIARCALLDQRREALEEDDGEILVPNLG